MVFKVFNNREGVIGGLLKYLSTNCKPVAQNPCRKTKPITPPGPNQIESAKCQGRNLVFGRLGLLSSSYLHWTASAPPANALLAS